VGRSKAVFLCGDCGHRSLQWQGRCPGCGAWNTLQETAAFPDSQQRVEVPGQAQAEVVALADIRCAEQERISSGLAEFDRVLGGGLVPGAAILLGGPPGAGKSTLLLQTAANLCGRHPVLYLSGEESLQQVAGRARRLGLSGNGLELMEETRLETALAVARKQRPSLLVVDSIQVMVMAGLGSSAGGVAQVRECAAQLTRFARETGCVLLLVGHVTKDGNLAGPKVLEHLIDVSLLLEGEADQRYRTLRAQKNRFGRVHELGVFVMTEQGLREVPNPSAIFLSRPRTPAPGSVVAALREGTRPLLVEIQALVDDSRSPVPQRVSVGMEARRLSMLLAILHRHGGLAVSGQDVFVNVVGGVQILETGADLPVLLAVASSLRNRPLPGDLIAFGELGLTGEMRPVPGGQERLREAAKHGFHHAVLPVANRAKESLQGLAPLGFERLQEALDGVFAL